MPLEIVPGHNQNMDQTAVVLAQPHISETESSKSLFDGISMDNILAI